MLQDKLYFKLNSLKGVTSFKDKDLNITLTSQGKIAAVCYFRMTTMNIFNGLLVESIIQITEKEYNELYPPTKWFVGKPVIPPDPPIPTDPNKITLMFGNSIPAVSLGKIGDFYFRTHQKGQIYEKTSDGWVLRFDFISSHKIGIPFTDQTELDIPWDSTRVSEFGLWPTIQAWILNPTEGIYELTTVPMNFVNMEPDNIHINLGGSNSGIIIIS